MNATIHKCVALSLLVCGLLAGGCATPAKSTAMVAAPALGVERRHEGSVAITVTGGSETSAAGASKISNEDFATALRESIEQSGVFASVIDPGASGDYKLDVTIVRLDQPLMGFSMTVTIETNWTLSRASDDSVQWQKGIQSTYTAGMSESMVGVTRLRLANEGAARENIRDAINQMGALTLE